MKSLSRQRLIFGCHNKGYRTLKMVQNGISTPTLNHYQRRNSTFLWIQAHRSLNDRPFSPRYPAHSWLYVSSSTISSKQSQASGSLARSWYGCGARPLPHGTHGKTAYHLDVADDVLIELKAYAARVRRRHRELARAVRNNE